MEQPLESMVMCILSRAARRTRVIGPTAPDSDSPPLQPIQSEEQSWPRWSSRSSVPTAGTR